MTEIRTTMASEDSPDFVPPIADFRAPLSRSQVLLINGGALVVAGWAIAIVAAMIPVGYHFPLGAIVFVGSGLLSLATSGCALVLAIVALVVRRPWVPQSRFNGGRRLVVPFAIALLGVAGLSLIGEKALAIVSLAVH